MSSVYLLSNQGIRALLLQLKGAFMEKKRYIVAYDVADGTRRRYIAKIMENFGYRVQYSVFEVIGSEDRKNRMEQQLLRILDEEEDSILIYELDADSWQKRKVYGNIKHREEFLSDAYMKL